MRSRTVCPYCHVPMGKTPGRPQAKKLADMTIPPPREPVYERPPMDECEEEVWPFPLSDGEELRCRRRTWLQQPAFLCDFAIIYITRDGSEWPEVARIDCCHSEVHHHQLRRGSSDTVGERTSIAQIPAQRGWETVDSWYPRALTLMRDGWNERRRRWSGDHT